MEKKDRKFFHLCMNCLHPDYTHSLGDGGSCVHTEINEFGQRVVCGCREYYEWDGLYRPIKGGGYTTKNSSTKSIAQLLLSAE